MALFVRHNQEENKRMFASLPFILLLIFQGFARQDCAEFLCSSQDLVNIPVQARSLRSFDELFATLSLVGNDNKSGIDAKREASPRKGIKIVRIPTDGSGNLDAGFLEVQRSRDGPVG